MLVFALAACGEREFEPVVAVEEDVEPLPAPLPAAGAVITPQDGDVVGGPAAMPADALQPGALAVIAPVPAQAVGTLAAPTEGTLVVMDPASPDAPVAAIGFADEGPRQAGPGAQTDASFDARAVAVPASSVQPPAVAAPVASGAVASQPATVAASTEGAVAAVRAYYDALRAGDVARAYASWSDGGRASGRSPEQFAAGARAQAIQSVSVGEPARSGGAGQVEVPVTVTSRGADGREVREVGSFVMRASPGGAGASWRIAAAELRELQP